MRRVLAIAIALMFAALVLSPTMGYSFQSFSHPYSIKSVRVNYTISPQAPSHEPAVKVTRVPFSLKYVSATPQKTETIGAATEGNIAVPVSSANVTEISPIKASVTADISTLRTRY